MRKEIKLPDGLVDKLVKEYNNGKTMMALAKEYSLSYKLIYNRLHKYGAKIRSVYRNLNDSEKNDIVSSYGIEAGAADFARKYDTSITTITKLLKKSNVEITNTPSDAKLRTGSFVDRGCFTDFTREADAYFYGLLLSDGCLVKGTNSIQIALKHTDSDILTKYRNWLKAERSISYLKHGPNKAYEKCVFNFSDSVIAGNLIAQGFESNKSMKEKVPLFYHLTEDLNIKRNFWRGMVDGDGTVKLNPRRLSLVGSNEIITEFNSFIEEYCDCKKQTLQVDKRYPDFFYTRLHGSSASKIAKVLYEDCEYALERKLLAANELMKSTHLYRVPQTVPRVKKIKQ